MNRRVVITGLGAVTPVGNDVPTMWSNLLAGKGGAGPITLFDAAAFKTKLACEVKNFDAGTLIGKKDARRMDRFTQLAVVAAQQALNDSALIVNADNTARIGVYIGSGIGGIGTWRDAFDFIALGDGNVQVCTAAMVYGFKIVQEMIDGLSEYMDSMGFATTAAFQGRALPTVTDWQYLNLNAISKAVIDQEKCIECGRCHIACEDTSHQAISAVKDGKRHFEVRDEDCVGCNLCVTVCPVPECITLRTLAPGEVDARTGKAVVAQPANWTAHPNNPMRQSVPA